MSTAIPVEVFEILEDKLGREQAHAIVKEMEAAAQTIATQKKAELREDLVKELASKADILLMDAKHDGKIDKLRSEVRLYFAVTLAVIVITNPRALDLIAKILGVAK